MKENNIVNQLERNIEGLATHITEQDAEMFRMSKQIDKMEKRLKQLEGRFKESGIDAVVDPSREAADDKPPHY